MNIKTLTLGLFLIAGTTLTAQSQPKRNMKALRDSIFTVMKLSDENRSAMHKLIVESSERRKAINEDASLSDEQKQARLKEWHTEYRNREKSLMTLEQQAIWKQFNENLKKK